MPQSKDSSVQVAIIVAALLAVVGGGWLFLKNGEDEAADSPVVVKHEQTTEQAQSESSVVATVPVDTALQMAEMAFQSGQLIGDEEGSAVYFYRQVLQQDPKNARAQSGLDLIATQLTDEAHALMKKKSYAGVVERISHLQQISPDSEYVVGLQDMLTDKTKVMFAQMYQAIEATEFNDAEDIANELGKIPGADSGRISAALVTIASRRNAIEMAAAEDALKENAIIAKSDDVDVQISILPPVEEAPEPVDNISPLIVKAKARITENRLFKPDGDSAVDFFKQVLALDANNSDAKLGLRGLVQNMTSRAYKAAKNSDWEAASEILTLAEHAGMANNLIEQARDEIKQQRIDQAINQLVKIDEFEVEKTVAPKYPSRAISRSVEGWVKLEFTVAETGETKNLRIVGSSERFAKLFGRAAITAVEQWRFKPRLLEGQAIAQRSQTTLQFKLAD